MSQLPIIQSLWIGDRLSTMEQLCITSFLHHEHTFHLYTYGEIQNIPAGTVLKDAHSIIPREKIFKYKNHNSYAGFANLFRYKLLLEKGGFWVDTDNVCVRPFEQVEEYIFASQSVKQENVETTEHVNNNIIKAPAGSSIMEYCFDVASRKNPEHLKWGETGPALLHAAVKRFDLETFVKPVTTYNAINWWEWDKIIDADAKSIYLPKEAFSIHLWNELWRRNEIDKDAQFPENSLYEQFKRTYLHTTYDKSRPDYVLHKTRLDPEDINMIRDTAIAIEKLNPAMAYRLMSIAHKARPDGTFIERKLKQYEKIVTDL